jgi:hypothetical protein
MVEGRGRKREGGRGGERECKKTGHMVLTPATELRR